MDPLAELRQERRPIIVPSVAIVVTILAFNALGDWLRDRFDPITARSAGP